MENIDKRVQRNILNYWPQLNFFSNESLQLSAHTGKYCHGRYHQTFNCQWPEVSLATLVPSNLPEKFPGHPSLGQWLLPKWQPQRTAAEEHFSQLLVCF